MKIQHIFLLAAMTATTTANAAKEYYKWVDAHGSTHYTTTPPPKTKGIKSNGKIKTYGTGGSQDKPSSTQVVNPTPQPSGDSPNAANKLPQNISASDPALQAK